MKHKMPRLIYDIPEAIQTRMRSFEGQDASDRQDGTLRAGLAASQEVGVTHD